MVIGQSVGYTLLWYVSDFYDDNKYFINCILTLKVVPFVVSLSQF